MKIPLAPTVAIVATLALLLIPKAVTIEEGIYERRQEAIQSFLDSKESPLATETEFLLQHKHWRLLIAISAIESQYCKKQLGFNCWGIGGDSAYRQYASLANAITDADALIEHWQQRGRWLTVADMNGHYVQPYNPTWERVVNDVLHTIDEIETNIVTNG